jgi:hypothetical protein
MERVMSDVGYAEATGSEVVGQHGRHVKLDLSSVRSDADASVTLLEEQIRAIEVRGYVVVFLGEEHRHAVDEAVTQSVLRLPPLMMPGSTRVIYERGLDATYPLIHHDLSARTEKISWGRNRRQRSEQIAAMIKDAFEEHDMRVVYVPCGSAHRDEIFESLDGMLASEFTFISKPSSTD